MGYFKKTYSDIRNKEKYDKAQGKKTQPKGIGEREREAPPRLKIQQYSMTLVPWSPP
jgi:hypothetical protein